MTNKNLQKVAKIAVERVNDHRQEGGGHFQHLLQLHIAIIHFVLQKLK
jgi:hypothetical protein